MEGSGALDTLIALIEEHAWTEEEHERLRSARRSIMQMLEIAIAAETLIDLQINAELDGSRQADLHAQKSHLEATVRKLLIALRCLPAADSD